MAALSLSTEVSATRPPFPYPGLRPFEPDEWSIFFGRETMIDELIERLARQRFVLIHGMSGSGKSSLVRAGVLPKLARQHLRHSAAWLTCAMRPSGGPLWNLAAEFARLEGRGGDVARIGEIIRLFNRRGATLSQVVDSLDGLAGKRLCLLVDQFEELFRFERETSREEAELFIDLLIGELPEESEAIDEASPDSKVAAQPDHRGNLHIIITMRSEFLGECARFDRFAETINRTQYLVPRLTRAGLMRAIRQPARLYGGEVTDELADRLIADVRGQLDELPLIQHGLMLFWHEHTQAQPGGKIVLDSAMLDRADGLAQLLSDHADRVMKMAAPDELRRNAVERLFRSLTDINAEGQAIRRPQSFRDLVAVCGASADALRGIINEFRAEGVSFITPYLPAPINDETIIDISHESLIRYWQAIADPQNGWLRNEFEDGLVWRSLLLEAKEFAQDKKRILSPAATAERRKWLAQQTRAWSERYGGHWELVDRLLKASRKATIRARRIRRLLLPPLIFIAIFAAYFLIRSIAPQLEDGLKVALGSFMLLLGLWMVAEIFLIIFDYGLEFASKRRFLRHKSQSTPLEEAVTSPPLDRRAIQARPSRRFAIIAAAFGVVAIAATAAGIHVVTTSAPRSLTGHSQPVYSVVFSPDGRILASGSRDRTIKIWDVASGQLLRTLSGHSDSVSSVAFSPDGRTLASGSRDHTVKLWDAKGGQLLRTLGGHLHSVLSVAFSPDGRALASGSADKTIKLWDTTTGQLQRTLTGDAGSVLSVAFSPDGLTLASGSADNTIKLWDVASGQIQLTFRNHYGWVESITFSPDGRTLASGSYDQTIKLWDVKKEELQLTFRGHSEWVQSVAFSPDGHTLASGSNNTTIKLWDVTRQEFQRTLKGHSGAVFSVAFSPDGHTLASGSDDKTIKLWDLGKTR